MDVLRQVVEKYCSEEFEALYPYFVPDGFVLQSRYQKRKIPVQVFNMYVKLPMEHRQSFIDFVVNRDWFEEVPCTVQETVDHVEMCYDDYDNLEDFEFESINLVSRVFPRSKRGYEDLSRLIPEGYVFEDEWFLVRSPSLLAKLRSIIASLVCIRIGLGRREDFRSCYVDSVCEPQMEEPTELGTTVQASNVVLNEKELISADIAICDKQPVWHKFCSTEFVPSYDPLVDRFFMFKNLIWTTGHTADYQLYSAVLPADVFDPNYSTSVPMYAPFNMHRYWSGDMEIRFHLNSNKFQHGMLQCSFVHLDEYAWVPRKLSPVRATANHCLLNAGVSNEALLRIPYLHVKPYIHTKKRAGSVDPLHLGNLLIKVLVPLRTGKDGPTQCNLSLFARFPNSRFTGLRDLTVVEPQMEAAAAILAAKSIYDTINMDNPTTTAPAKYVIPVQSHSLCQANNLVAPLNRLDLMNNTVGVGRFGELCPSETAINYITQVYGMLKPIEWVSNDVGKNQSGYLLWSMDVHPIGDKNCLHTYGLNTTPLSLYSVPPVGVVSGLFQYWRGSIEFRFDIVASQFHTGRLLVAYIPGAHADMEVTIEQARNSAYIEFSLSDAASFSFMVPFISDRVWWHRKYGGPQRRSEYFAPSRIYMFVLNSLVHMDSVDPRVTIIPYMRGGNDFEVSVPAQPTFGLAQNPEVYVPKNDEMHALPGYEPFYCGNWRGFYDSRKYILRYGPGTDHVAQFAAPYMSLSGVAVFWRPRDLSKMCTMDIEDPDNKGKSIIVKVGYVVCIRDSGYTYGIPFPDTVVGKSTADRVAFMYKRGRPIPEIDQYLYDCRNETPDELSTTGLLFDPIKCVTTKLKLQSSFEFVEVEPQMESQRTMDGVVLQPTGVLPSTGNGRITFGEQFIDLKDLARRYQLYWHGTVKTESMRLERDQSASFMSFSAIPTGLPLVVNDVEVENNVFRDGPIPIISSGYRFYRGGLRFKLIFEAGIMATLWVQHHPDRSASSPLVRMGKFNTKQDRFRNHGFAMYIQNLAKNNVVEFEVPYYQCGMYGFLPLLDKYDNELNEHVGLGDITLGFMNARNLKEQFEVSIYYSFADDMSLHNFVGYPLMIFCDEIIDKFPDDVGARTVEPQMFASMLTSVASTLGGTVVGKIAATPYDALKREVVTEIRSEVGKVVEPRVHEIKEVVKEKTDEILACSADWYKNVAITTAFGNLVHVLVNPTIATMAISVANILVTLVSGTISMVSSLVDVLKSLFTYNWFTFTGERSTVHAQGDTKEEDHTKPVLAILFTSVCAALGMSCKAKGAYFDLMKNINMTAMLSNNILTFIKNCGDAIVYYTKYVLGENDPAIRAKILLENAGPEINDWFNECQYLLDPRLEIRYAYERQLIARVFDACVIGSIMVSDNIPKHIPGGKVIWDVYNKMCELRAKLIERGNHPDVRFECFPLWFSGPPGVGKSYLTPDVCKRMLTGIEYSFRGSMLYYLEPGKKYWNGMLNQPVIVRDDAFQVNGTFLDEELASLFAICSSSVLNPPMAAVGDKERRVNPLIYLMHSNAAFPDITNRTLNSTAVYRRRKALVEVDLTLDIKKKYPNFLDSSELEESELVNFSHLRFRFARDPKNPRTAYGPWMDYEAMSAELVIRFRRHYERECINFRRRMCDMYSLDESFNETYLSDSIPNLGDKVGLAERIIARKREIAALIAEMEDPLNQEEENIVKMYFKKVKNYVFPQNGPVVLREDYFMREQHHAQQQHGPEREQFEWTREQINGLYNYLSGTQIMEGICKTNGISYTCMKNIIGPLILDKQEVSRFMVCIQGDVPQTFECALGDGTFSLDAAVDHPSLNLRYAGIRFDISALLWPYMTDRSGYATMMGDHGDRTDLDRLRSWLMRVLFIQMNTQILDKLFMFDLNASDDKFMYQRQVRDILLQENKTPEEKMQDLRHYILALRVLCAEVVTCDCVRFWYRAIDKIADLRFCRARELYTHTDCLGLRHTCGVCTHGSIVSTAFFQRCVAYMYERQFAAEILAGVYDVPIIRQDNISDKRRVVEYVTKKMECWYEHYLKPGFAAVIRFIIQMLPTLIGALISILVVTGLKYGLSAIGNACFGSSAEPEPSFTPQGNNYFKFDMPKAPKREMPEVSSRVFAQTSVQQRSVIASKIEDNTVFICAFWVENDMRMTRQSRCLVLQGHRMLILRHYAEEYMSMVKRQLQGLRFVLYFGMKGKICQQEVVPCDLFSNVCWASVEGDFMATNFGILVLPKYLPLFKNILPLIATKASHNSVGALVDIYAVQDKASFDLPLEVKRNYVVGAGEHSTAVTMDRVYTYLRQGRGLCGSVLVCGNVNNGNGGIIGIHVGGRGDSGIGIAEPIYREMFERLDSVLMKEVEVITLPLKPLEEATIELDSNLLLYGCVDKKFAHKESGKTKILKSPLYDVVYQHETEVNPLKPNDPRQPPGSHPLQDGCNKHGSGIIVPFPEKHITAASDYINNVMLREIVPVRAHIQPLTMQQAVCGDPEIPYFEALNFKSSEGFPLSAFRPKTAHDKRWLFDLENGEFGYQLKGVNEQLLHLMRLRDKCFEEQRKPITLHVDCLKDYRLPIEKCKIKGKTRIFSIAPIQCTLDTRMYLNDFCAAVKSSRIKNSIGIGINPDSLEWTKLVHYLFEVGEKIITLDYSNYGPSLPSQLVLASINSIVQWFTTWRARLDHLKRVEWILKCDMLNPVHLCENLVYQTLNGISSGSPVTGELNSLPNIYIMAMCWLGITGCGMSEYGENVRLVVYGDDLIMSVSDAFIDKFNAISIKSFLHLHGLTVTGAQKDEELKPYGTIFESTFLKRGFSPHPVRSGLWLAPVEKRSVQECINWIHDSDDEKEAVRETCRASLELAYGHGEDYYEKHRQKILSALSRLGMTLNSKSWSEIDESIFGSDTQDFDEFKPFKVKLPWFMTNYRGLFQ